MVTSGFFGSKDHDRRYNAEQMGRIFDGVIRDGVYRTIGTRFETLANGKDMMLTIGIGRAWFNHTWTYNDAPLPLEVPQSELILKRIDAVVLTVDTTIPVRSNSITIVKGTPSSNPVRPTMIQTEKVHQYALAYINVGVNVTAINQADITNMVGQEPVPYVISPLEKLDISEQVKQWSDEWRQFYITETTDMADTSAFWKESWDAWYEAYTSENLNDAGRFKEQMTKDFQVWFDSLKDILDEDTAGNLKNLIDDIASRVVKLEDFRKDLMMERAIYDPLQDDEGNEILDFNAEPIQGSVKFEAAGRSEELIKSYANIMGTPVTLEDFTRYYKREFPIDFVANFPGSFNSAFPSAFNTSIKTYTDNLCRNKDVPLSLRKTIYGGRKYLGSSFTQEQKQAVNNGTFDGLAIGDYWRTSDYNFVIADMDYFPNLLRNGLHHLIIVPETAVGTYAFATNVLEGAVYSSYTLSQCEIPTKGSVATLNRINDIFGSTYVGSYNTHVFDSLGNTLINIPNADTAGSTSYLVSIFPKYSWVEWKSLMLNSIGVFGRQFECINKSQGPFYKQLALFTIHPEAIATGEQYWLSDMNYLDYSNNELKILGAYIVNFDGKENLMFNLNTTACGIRVAHIIVGTPNS